MAALLEPIRSTSDSSIGAGLWALGARSRWLYSHAGVFLDSLDGVDEILAGSNHCSVYGMPGAVSLHDLLDAVQPVGLARCERQVRSGSPLRRDDSDCLTRKLGSMPAGTGRRSTAEKYSIQRGSRRPRLTPSATFIRPPCQQFASRGSGLRWSGSCRVLHCAQFRLKGADLLAQGLYVSASCCLAFFLHLPYAVEKP